MFPQRSPTPLIVPCACDAPGADGRQGIGDGQAGIVVRVDSDRGERSAFTAATASAICSGMVPPLVSHNSQHRCPGFLRRQQRAQCVVAIGLEGVEEMLGVVNHLPPGLAHQPDRIADHLQVFFRRSRSEPSST